MRFTVRRVGRPVGTVKSWRSRGRERLRHRLLRLGLAPSAGLAAVLAADRAQAAAPTALVKSTTLAVMHITARRAAVPAISSEVARLVNGALKTMFYCKLKRVIIALFLVTAAIGTGMLARGGPGADAVRGGSDRASPKDAGHRTGPDYVGRVDWGVVHVGALAEAEVNVRFQGDEDADLSVEVEAPAFVTVKNLRVMRGDGERPGQTGCSVTLTADTKRAARRAGEVKVRLGRHVANVPVVVSIVPTAPGSTKVLFVSGGFCTDSNHANYYRSWFDLVGAANLDVSYRESLYFQFPEWQFDSDLLPVLPEELARYDVIVLADGGTVYLDDTAVFMLRRFVESGKRLVVTASPFLVGSVLHANMILEPCGLRMLNQEVPYEKGLGLIEAARIVADPLTKGVEKLTTSRPAPIVVQKGDRVENSPFRPAPIAVQKGDRAEILAFLPGNQNGFVAVSRLGKGEVVAIGTALVPSWIGDRGKGTDNARLLRTLLTAKTRP